MANSLYDRFRSAWNVFREKEREHGPGKYDLGPSSSWYSSRPFSVGVPTESIVAKIYNQIAVDTAATGLRHVRLGKDQRYEEDIQSGLSECLALKANVDQTARAFLQDLVLTMFDHGVAAIVPVDTDLNPDSTAGFDVKTMRVGTIVQWHPRHVRLNVYNDRSGVRQEIVLPKERVAIVTNPLYEVMNRPSGDLKRLSEKLRLLDVIDNQSSSGKLDIIIQLPYALKTDMQRDRAKDRLGFIESQLKDSKYGIAYIDANEHITQLNRPSNNNLMEQVEYLTKEVYNALGITEEVFRGTASESTMLNYYNRTVRPILEEISLAMTSTFLSAKARSEGQAIRYYRDPFKLVPMNTFAATATNFISAQILTSNEVRAILGYKPADEAQADSLQNPNINPVSIPGTGTSEDFNLDLSGEDNEQA